MLCWTLIPVLQEEGWPACLPSPEGPLPAPRPVSIPHGSHAIAAAAVSLLGCSPSRVALWPLSGGADSSPGVVCPPSGRGPGPPEEARQLADVHPAAPGGWRWAAPGAVPAAGGRPCAGRKDLYGGTLPGGGLGRISEGKAAGGVLRYSRCGNRSLQMATEAF